MKLQWKDVGRWEEFKYECIKLSTGFYAEEYVNATKDIYERLTYIQPVTYIQPDKKQRSEKSERNWGIYTHLFPWSIYIVEIDSWKKFDPIKTDLILLEKNQPT